LYLSNITTVRGLLYVYAYDQEYDVRMTQRSRDLEFCFNASFRRPDYLGIDCGLRTFSLL